VRKPRAKPPAMIPMVQSMMPDMRVVSPPAASVVGAGTYMPVVTTPVTDHMPMRRLMPSSILTRAMEREELQGVDLRLDAFDLSAPKKVLLESEYGSIVRPLDECVAVGDLFWKSISDDSQMLQDSDKQFLHDIFNPTMSDRRGEGDCFVPPDASPSYVAKLRSLVKDEEAVRMQRREHFFSLNFSTSDPGLLFPSSWRPGFEVARGRSAGEVPEESSQGALHSRPDFINLPYWEHVLDGTEADFDKSSEEGLRFRVYHLGSLEIRTIQGLGDSEVVGAVFSTQPHARVTRSKKLSANDKVVKALLYIEAGHLESILVDGVKKSATNAGLFRHYYTVLETQEGNKVVTEQLASGRTTWQVNPEDLEYRNSFAKVIRKMDCNAGIRVRDLKDHQEEEGQNISEASQSACKVYAQSMCRMACGKDDISSYKYKQSIALKKNGIDMGLAKINVPYFEMRERGLDNQRH